MTFEMDRSQLKLLKTCCQLKSLKQDSGRKKPAVCLARFEF